MCVYLNHYISIINLSSIQLVSVHQSGGGMAGDGVHSYAATLIHAAKVNKN